MIAPDEQGKQRDRNADQRCADEEILESRSFDYEAGGARRRAMSNHENEATGAQCLRDMWRS
jgi:hypothetical protein